jgi:xanthomonalisin
VAAEANTDNYICYNGTCAGGWGGTSFAAPRWAGYLALANQQAVAGGLPVLGFLNPELYTIGLGANYSANFHDITSGSNGTYLTEKGYDLVTGWGSPNGAGLINTLAP